MYLDLQHREKVLIEGEEYEFDMFLAENSGRGDAVDELQFIKVRGRRAEQWTLEHFDRLYNEGKIVFGIRDQHKADRPFDDGLDDRPEEALSEKEKRQRLKKRVRRHYLVEYDKCPVSLSDKSLRAFIAEVEKSFGQPHSAPSPGTFRRWLRRGEAGDRRAVFMGDRYPTGPSDMRIDAIAQQVLFETAEEFWDDRSVSYQDIYDAVVSKIVKVNSDRKQTGLDEIQAPSYWTVYRYLKNNSNYERSRRRDGSRAANQIYKPLKGSLEVDRILDKAIADHTVLDCFAVDDQSGEAIGRPYLTLIVDVKSRYPLGFCLSFEPPSIHTIMAALRMAVVRKAWINKAYPAIKEEWVAWGRPRTILVDNGWEFTGISFSDACAIANISVEWAGVRNPQYKGICERLFGTIRTQFSRKLPGGVPFKPEVMKELGIDAQGKAVLTLSQLHMLLCHYLIELYGNHPHSTLKKSPKQAWLERVEKDGIERVNDMRALRLALGRIVRDKQLTREGIRHRGLVYRSDQELKLLSDGLSRQRKRGVRKGALLVNIKEFPEDVSRIAVPDPANNTYVEFRCTMKRYPSGGLSIRQHELIWKSTSADAQGALSETELCVRRDRLRTLIRSLIPASNIRNKKRLVRNEPPPFDSTGPYSSEAVVPDVEGATVDAEGSVIIHVSPMDNYSDLGEIDVMPPRAKRNGGKKKSSAGASSVADSEIAPSSVSLVAAEANPLERFNLQDLLAKAARQEGLT